MNNTLIVLLSMALLIGLPLIIICVFSFISNRAAKKVSIKEKLNEDDFKKSQEYYRDIIKKYSPTLLSYIDDFQLDLPRDIIATLMLLEKKKCVKIENDVLKIDESEVEKQTELNEIEKYILRNIRNGILEVNMSSIKNEVQEEGIRNKVLNREIKTDSKNGRKNEIFLLVFIILISIGYLGNLLNIQILDLTFGIVIILLVAFGLIYFIYSEKLSKYRKQDAVNRTTKGKELNKKLEGLKIYLEDYSNIQDKEAEMIAIWEDYLIYAIIFYQNDIAISKYKKFIKLIKKPQIEVKKEMERKNGIF